jgi:hypothetical protein
VVGCKEVAAGGGAALTVQLPFNCEPGTLCRSGRRARPVQSARAAAHHALPTHHSTTSAEMKKSK